MIKPTIGRVVWYHPLNSNRAADVHAALITKVWNNRCVNLAVFDEAGVPYSRTSVYLLQAGDPVPTHAYAEWMPYQLGQAAKTEALEKQVGALPENISAATQSDPAFDNLPRSR